ncbi:MAG: chromate transporter, partial [Firmicutes bacterium]|nr:chromate transporter [Bacillota bacterium]
MKLWQLFVAFFRVGIFGYGGGPGSISLIKVEVVSNFKWLTDGEFAEALAIGNALPGPLATKLAAYVGYKTAGLAGAAVGLAAVALPTALAIITLYRLFAMYQGSPRMKGALQAVKPLVVV